MDSRSIRKSIAPTPPTIYLICLWVFLRAVMPLLGLIGQYNINKSFIDQTGSNNLGSSSFFEWLFTSNKLGLVTIIISVVFLITGIGIVIGKKWGRSGYLILSLIVLLWNIRAVALGQYYIPLYSFVALGLAYWYFRQPEILRFFGTKDISPAFLNRKILNAPLDLAISLGIFIVLIILEIISLI